MSISKQTKSNLGKGLSIITSAATIIVLSGVALVPFGASADHSTAHTIEQLLAQITSLQAQLQALQAGTTAPSTACNFTRSLTVGVVGDDVKCLQMYLNGAGYSVSASGAGSAGNETIYFGSRTQSAVASWQAANGVSPAVGYFGSISRAKYQTLAGTPGAPGTPGATPTPTGPFSASLAPGNPGAQTITKNAQAVEFLKVRFSGSGTVSSLTFKRLGAGATGDFDNLYVYDGATRLTSGKSLSSATGEVTFVNLNLSVSGTKDISLVADMNGTAGNTNYFQITAASATVSVSGLPVSGNNFSIAGATSGGITTAKVGSLGNPNVGAKNAQVSEFKLTADTEAASVKRVTMLQGGTVKPGDLTNVKLVQGTTEWPGIVTKDGHVVFDLGSGFSIVKGGNAIFKVYADLGGKVDETVKLYIEELLDIWAIGDQYGYAMAVTNSALDAVGEAHAITLQGGTLTITFNGPNATNVGTDTSDTVLMRYAMTAQSNIEVRKTEFTLCLDDGGEGTYDNAADTTNGWADLDDFKVSDEDTLVVVLGPQDGSAFTVSDADTCPNSKTGAQKSFNDVFDLSAGQTKNLKVTADIKTANTRSGQALTADDKIKAVLDSYVDDTPDLAVMKYPDTNTSVADADIVPGADVASNEMTIQASSLTIGLAGTPGSQTFVKGTKNVDVVGITFAANQASQLKVTDVTLTGYASDNTTTFDEGTDVTDTAVSVANAMTNFKLVEAESGIVIADSTKITTNNLNVQNTGTVKFSFAGTPWMIAAGATKTLLVKVDLSTNAASGTAGDAYAFDIGATTDITATDDASNTINSGNSAVNGTTSPTKKLTVKGGGSMKIAAHPDSQIKGGVYWGQVDAPISKFRLTSTDEAFFLEKFTIAASVAIEATDAKANVKQVKLTYKNKDGSTLTTVQSFTQGASANFGWSYGGSGTDTRPYVPKDSSLVVDVAASLRTKAEGATQDTFTGNNGASFSLDFADRYDGSTANGFKAVGEGSGTIVDGSATDLTWVAGANNQFVYRVFPKFATVAIAGPYDLVGTPTVFKFSITAMGLGDSNLRFDNEAVGSGAIKFEILSSGAAGGDTSITTYDDVSGETIDTLTLTNDGDTTDASYSMDFTSKDIEISGGNTKTFRIQMNSTTVYDDAAQVGVSADYFQVVLRDASVEDPDLVRWVGNYDNTTNALQSSMTESGIIRSLPLFGPTFTRN